MRFNIAKYLFTILFFLASYNTAAEKPQGIIFAAGDIAACNKMTPGRGAINTAALLDKLMQKHPDAKILALGDLAYNSSSREELNSCYEPTWGRHKDHTLPVPGNHEYYPTRDFAKGYNLDHYNEYWRDRFATFPADAGEPEQGYYKIDIGNWRLIAVNTEVIVDNAETLAKYPMQMFQRIPDEAERNKNIAALKRLLAPVNASYSSKRENQRKWLEEKALNDEKQCKLVFAHHPKYSSGKHGNDKNQTKALTALYKTFYNKNVSLVLSGHDHHYERFFPLDGKGYRDFKKGMRSFVVGTGGIWMRALPNRQANSEVRRNDVWGVLKIELFENSYSWQFIPTEGEPFDKYSESCVPRNQE